jgi:hypothetical protein
LQESELARSTRVECQGLTEQQVKPLIDQAESLISQASSITP